MAGPLIINDNGLATKDPADELLYEFRWGTRHLPATAQIANSSFTITALRPVGDTALISDSAATVGTQTTKIRLMDGTVGALYRITNQIITNELPAQTIERSFLLLIEQK